MSTAVKQCAAIEYHQTFTQDFNAFKVYRSRIITSIHSCAGPQRQYFSLENLACAPLILTASTAICLKHESNNLDAAYRSHSIELNPSPRTIASIKNICHRTTHSINSILFAGHSLAEPYQLGQVEWQRQEFGVFELCLLMPSLMGDECSYLRRSQHSSLQSKLRNLFRRVNYSVLDG